VADKQVVGVGYKLELLVEEEFVMVLLNHQLFFYLIQAVH